MKRSVVSEEDEIRELKSIITLLGLLIAFAISSPTASARTCVPGKKFKVSQVCGVVRSKDGSSVPDAEIKLTAMGNPHDTRLTKSEKDGGFSFADTPNGDYDIVINKGNFWPASQLFTVSGSQQEQKCSQPIQVVMAPVSGPVAGCSYVENGWKKSEPKK